MNLCLNHLITFHITQNRSHSLYNSLLGWSSLTPHCPSLVGHSSSVLRPSCFFSNSVCSELRIFLLFAILRMCDLLPFLLQNFIPVNMLIDGFFKKIIINMNRTQFHIHFRTTELLIPFP